MPAPFKVELAAHDPRWAEATKAESEALGTALGPTILVVHLPTPHRISIITGGLTYGTGY